MTSHSRTLVAWGHRGPRRLAIQRGPRSLSGPPRRSVPPSASSRPRPGGGATASCRRAASAAPTTF